MRKYRRPLSNAANRERSRRDRLVDRIGIDGIASFHHQRGRCFLCHDSLGPDPRVHYLVPLKKGGTGDVSNLRVICLRCQPTSPRARSTVSPVDTRREVVFDAQKGLCRWCSSPLVGAWALSRSLSGSCVECETRYHGLSDAEIEACADLL